MRTMLWFPLCVALVSCGGRTALPSAEATDAAQLSGCVLRRACQWNSQTQSFDKDCVSSLPVECPDAGPG
jgi:hypothetical protein